MNKLRKMGGVVTTLGTRCGLISGWVGGTEESNRSINQIQGEYGYRVQVRRARSMGNKREDPVHSHRECGARFPMSCQEKLRVAGTRVVKI